MSEAATSFRLELEDGTRVEGRGFGAPRAVGGEVVFNTAMSGYVETLTDPSYAGQILVLTYPLAGSYGVPAPRVAGGIEPPFESDRVQVQGLVVQDYIADHSHRSATRSLGEWLIDSGVPAVSGVDTRALTRRLREHGTMRGWLLPSGATRDDCAVVDMKEAVFLRVAPAERVTYEGGDLRIMLVDIGAKDNIVRSLVERGAAVERMPWWHGELEGVASTVDGIVIGNGPGDPQDLLHLEERVRGMLGTFGRPIFGICLGNQVLARAAGGETYRLPYGHRGVNQPVQDLLTRRCYVTSQNHGYAVRDESLPGGWEPWFVNMNDGTNEGIRSQLHPYYSVQFHPEARPGPEDTGYLFDDFLRLVGSMRRGR